MRFLLLFFLISTVDAYQYEVAVAAIFRDEGRFIKEWIEFHRLVGVDHFYLYNNLSQDDFRTTLKPYIEEGVVELFDIPFESVDDRDFNEIQCSCYSLALKKARGKANWLAIIDRLRGKPRPLGRGQER